MPTGKKKTHEEFIKEMEVKQPNIEVIGAYTGCNKKIKVKCKIDGYEWETKPNILLSGHGCPKCANHVTWSHNEFLARLKEINPNIVPLQEYKHSQTPIKCKCKVCGYEWKTRPNNLINNNTGCPKCTRQLADIKRTKTHEQFINELAQVNPDIQVLEPYKGAHIKIKVRCKICGHEWQVQPSNLLHGTGCPICAVINMKKTHEQFIEEMKVKHPNIEVLDTYEKNNIKIKCKCKIDDYEWETLPNTLLSGSGCPKCKGRKLSEQKTKTHDQFLQELQQINTDIEILGTYVKGKTKIKCKCKLCGHIWKTLPSDLLKEHGCPKCAGSLKKTHEQFMQEFYVKNTHAKDIEILGTYVNLKTKILCKCKIDGYIWQVTPNALLSRNNGCPKCGGNINKTHEQFIQELQEVNSDIEILGTYVNNNTKIKCKCKIDGYIWEATPSNLLRGTGCPKCVGNIKWTHEQFIEELKQINQDIEILGTYINATTKILCKCKICGHIWEPTPSSLLRGHGCPKCKITKGEKRVANYLNNLGIDYIYNTCYFKDLVSVKGGLMRPDFLIPSLKIWIEYDGEQHFRPVDFSSKMSEEQLQEQFKITQQNDQIKNQYAEQHNWTLIRIPYWDYDNIEQILDSYLKQEEELAL